MMKKIVSLCVIILCGIICAAQNIDQKKLSEDWNKLVDYVNCKYVDAYISGFGNAKDSSFKKYLKNIKPKIDSCTIDKSIGYESLSELLKENGWSVTEKNISSVINDCKSHQPDIAVLLDISCFDPKVQLLLSECKNSLEKELNEYYLEKNVNVEKKENLSDSKEQEGSNGNVLIWILLGLVVFEGLCIAFLWRRTMYIPDDEHIKNVCYESKRLDDKFQLKIQQYESIVEELKKKVSILEKRLSEPQQKLDTIEKKEIKPVQEIPVEVSDKFVLYAENNGDGCLCECPQAKAQYELLLKDSSAKEAVFTYCGDSLKAVARVDAFFKDVCDLIAYNDNATRVDMQKTGRAILQEDKWKVIEKGVVKFS